MLVVASTVRVTAGAVFLVIGLLMLVFNERVSGAMIADQQKRLGRLLSSRRGTSDGFYSSRPFRAYARGIVIIAGAFFVVVAVGLIVTKG